MPALKLFIVTAVLILVSNAHAVDPSGLERRTWRVQPRATHSNAGSRVPATESAPSPPYRPARQISDVEELPTAEPPLFYGSRPRPRTVMSGFEPLNSILPVQFVDSLFNPKQSQRCDDFGCDELPCGGCDGVGCGQCRASLYWVRADYLHWWLEGASVPALVTTSPVGTDRLDAGVLGLSTTSVLVGGGKFGDEGQSGGRIELGSWFPNRGNLGWHVAYLGLADAKDRFRFASTSVPILARPFFSVEPANLGQNAELVSFPGDEEGNISVDASTSFEAAELMLRWRLANARHRSLQFVAGYQYNRLDDDLAVNDFTRVIGGSSGLAIGTTIVENDQFQTENQFHGAALGILASARNCRTTLDFGMQLALGNNNSKVRINGSTTSSVPVIGGPNDVATTPGGLLALPSNIGVYEDDSFAIVPQMNLAIGYDVHPQVRATFGYRFLYWSQVARAAEQIDTEINLSQLDPSGINGEARPQFDFRMTDFWAQGINAGLDYRF